MTVNGFRQSRKTPRVLRVIVHAAYQAVLEGHPTPGFLMIIRTGIQHLRQRILIGNGHQFRTLFLCHCMKRQCQGNRQILIRQLTDPRHDTTGGDCQIPLADVQSVFIRQKPDKTKQVIVIIQRLSGSHDHHIGDALAAVLLDPVNLIQHLRGL